MNVEERQEGKGRMPPSMETIAAYDINTFKFKCSTDCGSVSSEVLVIVMIKVSGGSAVRKRQYSDPYAAKPSPGMPWRTALRAARCQYVAACSFVRVVQ